MIVTVISDTSLLLFLAKIDRLALLSTLYGRILLPEAADNDIETKATPDTERIRHWRKRAAVDVRGISAASQDQLPLDIGPGERAVIALGLDHDPHLVLLNDH